MTPNGWPSSDPLHPAGHDRHRGEAGRGSAAGSSPSASPSADDREGVVDVEPADEPKVDGRRRPTARRRRSAGGAGPPRRGWRGRRPPGPCRRSGRGRRPPGSTPMNAPADGSSALTMPVAGQTCRLGGRPAGSCRGGAAAGQPLEQAELGVAVRLPRPVELEMLVGQVGQDRDVVRDARRRGRARGRATSSR